jgi:hypothetical protein
MDDFLFFFNGFNECLLEKFFYSAIIYNCFHAVSLV